MPACLACRSMLPELVEGLLRYCPRCGAEVAAPSDDHWVPVARVSNLAELGYCEDLLRASHIETLLLDDDNFDSVHGIWRDSYTLSVRAEQSQAAAAVLESHLRASETSAAASTAAVTAANDEIQDYARSSRGPANDQAAFLSSPERRPAWSPLIACLLAGGFVYWGAATLFEAWQQAPLDADSTDLLQALEELDRPLTSELAGAGGRIVLRVDRGRGSIVIESDHDGDGEPDIRREFRDGKLVGP